MRGELPSVRRRKQREQLDALERELFTIVRRIQRLKRELAPPKGVKKRATRARG